MSNPNQQSIASLKRLARCLKRERQWGQVFEYGAMTKDLKVFTDSDYSEVIKCRRADARKTHTEGIHA